MLTTIFTDGGEGKKFKWPQPKLYDAPYSAVYAKAFFPAWEKKRAEMKEKEERGGEKEKEKEEEKEGQKGKGKEIAQPEEQDEKAKETAKAESVQGPTGGAAESDDPGVFTLGYWNNNDPKPKYHSPLTEREELHRRLVGNMKYLAGCGPFEVPCVQSILVDNMRLISVQANGIMSGDGGEYVIMLFAKVRREPEGNRVVSMFLEWPSHIDVGNMGWLLQLYLAWMGLLDWHYQQLCGFKVDAATHLVKYYQTKLRQHKGLYLRIEAKTYTLEQQKKAEREREKAEAESIQAAEMLFARQQEYGLDFGKMVARRRVMGKESFADKMAEMQTIVKEMAPLYPVATDEKTRRWMLKVTAMEVFNHEVLKILIAPGRQPNSKSAEIQKMLTDVQGPWEILLSRQDRYQTIKDVVDTHSHGWGKQMAETMQKKMRQWAAVVAMQDPEADDVEMNDVEDGYDEGDEDGHEGSRTESVDDMSL